jgi:hypothetical protein
MPVVSKPDSKQDVKGTPMPAETATEVPIEVTYDVPPVWTPGGTPLPFPTLPKDPPPPPITFTPTPSP